MTQGPIQAPVPLQKTHKLGSFDCGTPSLNAWLKERAVKSGENNSARTYLVCVDEVVVGYYCLATGAIVRDEAPKALQRNMADPIPVIVLGRFAVDMRYQGRGIGSGLLKDALLRVLQVSEIVGVKAVLVHALTEDAKRFYLQHSFIETLIHPMTLILPISTVRRAFQ